MMFLWPSSPIVVEVASAPDPKILADIHADGFSHAWSGADIAKLVADPSVLVVIARRDRVLGSRSPVGFVMVRSAADEAEVLSIAILKRYRNAGIGRKLMEAALRKLFAERISALFLEVASDNGPAFGLYDRLGFKTVGERLGYYREGREKPASALVMRYDLR